MKLFLNGKIVDGRFARISVFDRGFLYGDGVFETMLAKNGRAFLLDAHLRRLRRSARLIALDIPWTHDYLAAAVNRTLKASKLSGARVRLSVTRGIGAGGYMEKTKAVPNIVVAAMPFNGWPKEYYERGVKVIISKVRRNHPLSLSPAAKSMNCLNQILAAQEAMKNNAFEAVMLNIEGYVAEGSVSNIFIVKNGRIMTPLAGSGILDGITRGVVIGLAEKEKVPVVETLIRPAELYDADECFITSSTAGVMPVSSIGTGKVASGMPGPLTRRLALKLDEFTSLKTRG